MATRTSEPVLTRRATRRRTIARWRPTTATVAVVLGLLLSLGTGVAISSLAGGSGEMVALGLVVADLLLVAVVLAVARRGAERLGAATLGIRRTALAPAFGWGAVLLFSGFAFNALLVLIFGVPGDADGEGPVRDLATAKAILLTLGIAVTAPIAEEVAFRGYLFPALTRWRGPWLAAAITALLFGAAHFAALPPEMLLGAAAFGFGACLLFWFTGSLIPCVLVHSLNNAIVLAVITEGQLAWALLLAPLTCLLLLLPFARERAPEAAAPAPAGT